MKRKGWKLIRGGKWKRSVKSGDRQFTGIDVAQMPEETYAIIVRSVINRHKCDPDEARDSVHDLILELLAAGCGRESRRGYSKSFLIRTSRMKYAHAKGRAKRLICESALYEDDLERYLNKSDGSYESAKAREAREDRLSDVELAVKSLPETKQKILRMSREGMSGREIAGALGMTRGSMRVAKSEAVEELRRKLGPAGRNPPNNKARDPLIPMGRVGARRHRSHGEVSIRRLD